MESVKIRENQCLSVAISFLSSTSTQYLETDTSSENLIEIIGILGYNERCQKTERFIDYPTPTNRVFGL